MTDPASITSALAVDSLIIDPLQPALRSALGVGFGLAGSWTVAGAASALRQLAQLLSTSTSPDLTAAWFTTNYWKVASLAAALTLPFLFIAAVEAVLRGQPALLARAVFVQLPAALIGTGIAVPLISLLLAATDQMCSLVSSGTNGAASFLVTVAGESTAVSVLDGNSFIVCCIAALTVLAALMLMVELLIRQAAVYVVVLMLPLAFAAMVWPARRVWATRVLELLLALILSKFVIVAVLSLAGTALGDDHVGWQLLSAMTLIVLSCCAPWALMRLLPFTEVAAYAGEGIHQSGRELQQRLSAAKGHRDSPATIPASLAMASDSEDSLLEPTPFRARGSEGGGVDDAGDLGPAGSDTAGSSTGGTGTGDTAAGTPGTPGAAAATTATTAQAADLASEDPGAAGAASAGIAATDAGIVGDAGFGAGTSATGQAASPPTDAAAATTSTDPDAGAQYPANPLLDSGNYVAGGATLGHEGLFAAISEQDGRGSDPGLAPDPDPDPASAPDAALGPDPDDMPEPAGDPPESER